MTKRMTESDFIEKSKKIHHEKYSYEKINYINYTTKVCIICPIHGEFWQKPIEHLKGCGCQKCRIEKTKKKCGKTLDEFIEKAMQIHGNKYDYSKVKYINNYTKVIITCPIHGDFEQTPKNHLKGHNCNKCKKDNERLTTEQFIEKAKKIHDNKYNYSKVEYVNSQTKVCIICPEHGEFWQTPSSHLQGTNCKKCAIEENRNNMITTIDEFKLRANKIHNYKYDYSKVKFSKLKHKICIICPEHGEFWQIASDHLNGCGCIKCSGKEQYTTKTFIEKAKKIHGNKYDYSKVNYVNSETNITIICNNIDVYGNKHGEFQQTPHAHLTGQGCNKCKESHMETKMRNYFLRNNIVFDYQKHFKWLKQKSLDFYLPYYNIAIECQGIQHFEAIDFFGGEEGFIDTQKRDNMKKKLCEEHGIKLLYYTNIKEYNTFLDEKVYHNINELLIENNIINEK